MAGFHIESIQASDLSDLLSMMRALARHENEAEYLTADEDALLHSGFGENPRWRGFIARGGKEPLGYTTYTEDFHIWSGRDVISLDDLFVVPKARGQGVGEALIKEVFALADHGKAFVTWQVQPENTRALAFYKKLGAQVETLGKCYFGLRY